jgi:hypothetical protein
MSFHDSSPAVARIPALRAGAPSRGLATLNMKERERSFIMIKPDAVQRGLVRRWLTSG